MKRRTSAMARAPSRRVLDIMEDLDDGGRYASGPGASGDGVQSTMQGEGRVNRTNAMRARQARPLMLHNAYGARGNNLTKRESTRNITMKNEAKRKTNLLVERQFNESHNRRSSEVSITEREMRLLKQLDSNGGLQNQGLELGSLHIKKQSSASGSPFEASMQGSPFDQSMNKSSISAMDYRRPSSSDSRRVSGASSRPSIMKRMSVRMFGGNNSFNKDQSEDSQQFMKGKVEGRDIFEGYEDKLKKANSICRWNWLWLVWCFICPYPLWLSFVDCQMAYEITIVVNAIMLLNFVWTTILCWNYMWKMIRSFNTPFWQELDPETRDKVQHVVVLPTYKEPVQVLLETISSIANQTIAARLIVVVGFEEKTPEKEEKKRQIIKQFGDSVLALIFSVHPFGTPGEIQGACSNRNYAARFAVKYLLKEGLLPIDPETLEVDLDFTTVTVCDADTTFFYRYFENLTYCFLMEPPKSRYEVCWQSPLFYNIALDQRWFFTRVMGILRSYFMVGFLIGWDINTMSIYSQSLKLLIDSRYFHPGYQMDDIIYTLSAMKSTGKRIRIRTIDIPTLSGPTSGANFRDEFREWAVQAARWTIGAAEVFHYFTVKMIRGNFFLAGLEYFCWFVYYYIFILSGSVLINLSAFIIEVVGHFYEPVSITTCKPFVGLFGEDFAYQWILPFFFIYTYVTVGGTAFFMDALVSQILALKEEIHPLRNFVHWLMILPVWWMYGIVKFKSICKIAIEGKKACGHVASEKHALVGGAAPKVDNVEGGANDNDDDDDGGTGDLMNRNSSSHKPSGGSAAFNIHNKSGNRSDDGESTDGEDSFAGELTAPFTVDNKSKAKSKMYTGQNTSMKLSDLQQQDQSDSSFNASERDDFFPDDSKTGYMPVPNPESALGFDRRAAPDNTYGSSYGNPTKPQAANPLQRMVTNEEVKRHRERRPTAVMEMSSGEESSCVSSVVSSVDGSDDDDDDDSASAASQKQSIQRLSLARLPTKDSWKTRSENSGELKMTAAAAASSDASSSTSSVYNNQESPTPGTAGHGNSSMERGSLPSLTPMMHKNSDRELWQDEDGNRNHQGGGMASGGGMWQEEKKEANENMLRQVPAFFGKIRIALKAEITSMPDGDEYYFV